ncbi:MAG: class I SAM-dependent methyltransferase family protein [Candidatus Micrarchaeia archaeon]
MKNAQKAKEFLTRRKLLVRGKSLKKRGGFIYFPLSKTPSQKPSFECSYLQAEFKSRAQQQDLKTALKNSGKFSGKELEALVSSFDTVGDMVLIDVPKELEKREKLIAKTILASNNHVKVVAKKKSAMRGKYRVRKMQVVAGEKRTSTIYKESGCRFHLDLAQVYFSPRLSFERLRVARLVKPNKNVLVLFAGVGPFAIVIAKKQPSAKVRGIELNPKAVKFFKKNVAVNKMQDNLEVIEGDVNNVSMKLKNWADYISMPLPHTATDFLDAAFAAARKGCIITFYGFERTDGKKEAYFDGAENRVLVSPVLDRIKGACKKNKKKCRILNKRQVKTYAPYVVQVAVDFKVL